MIRTDRDALVCDLAETYGIFEMKALPGRLLATLCVGLRDDSRIRMRLSGNKIPRSEMLLAGMVDKLSMVAWLLSEDGQNGTNRPASVLDALLGGPAQESDLESFETPEDFEAEWTRRTGVEHGN